MLCVVEGCETNQRTVKQNGEEGVRFVPFPTTDYSCDRLRRLAKKRLHWWCRKCGVDFTTTLLNQLHVCSRHFIKGYCAPLWDTYNPDWIPSLYFTQPSMEPPVSFKTVAECVEFIQNEQLQEETIANPLLDHEPDQASLRTVLIDEIIAYPIGRAYYVLDEENENAAAYDPKCLSKELKKYLSPSSAVGKMVLEANNPHCPERMFSTNNSVTQLDLTVDPCWETEKVIMSLQNSVLELINRLDEPT